MSKEILLVVDAVSNEKGVEKSVIFEAIEAALASATRKRYGDDIEVRVAIDRATGSYDTFRRWKVFADDSKELEEPARELRLEDALDIDARAEIGGFVEQPMESVEFGRIAAQTAKQVIVQKVREAERDRQYQEYKDRIGDIVNGIVKRVEYGSVIVDLGRGEAIIRRDEMLPRESFRNGDRIRAYIYDVRREQRGPQFEQVVEIVAGELRDPRARARNAHDITLSRQRDQIGTAFTQDVFRLLGMHNQSNGHGLNACFAADLFRDGASVATIVGPQLSAPLTLERLRA